MRSRLAGALLTILIMANAVPAGIAASHRDWTLLPLGSFPLANGGQDIRVARPFDASGVIDTPIVFTALFNPDQASSGPIQVRFSAAERALPAWTVRAIGETYVVGREALAQLATDGGRLLRLRVELSNAPTGLVLMASGTPDLALAGANALGPLVSITKRLKPSAEREYLSATVNLTSRQLHMAKAEFARLARGDDESVARFARAALRRVRFAETETGPQLDFYAHYRLGLYGQQCGLFRAARLHFETAIQTLNTDFARPADALISDAWYRLGEMMDRCGEPTFAVAEVMNRAGQAANVVPNEWDVWVPIARAECGGEQHRARIELTAEQVAGTRQEWEWATQMIYGASGGHLKLNTRFTEIADASQAPYGTHADGLYGPLDEMIPLRGSFDCVMSVRPGGSSQTGGADCGPNGAALSDVGAGIGWEVHLREWARQFDWTLRAAEAGDGVPPPAEARGCGHQPIPSLGYGQRALLRYYVAPAMYVRLEVADPDDGQGYLRKWWIGPPHAVSAKPPTNGQPPHHAINYGPDRVAGIPRRFVTSHRDFVNLQAVAVAAGDELPPWCVTPATTYVLSPLRQAVRLWLGHNDGMAVWLNDELIHRGDYYAAARFADQNTPNMVAISALLLKGWNRIDVAVEGWPPPHDRGFGFSVRICDFANQAVAGLMLADERTTVPPELLIDPLRPRPGRFYRWDDVRGDFYRLLPRLAASDLARHANLGGGFDIADSLGATHGHVSIGLDPRSAGPADNRPVLRREWDYAKNQDVRLNNLLDWNREAVAVYPFNAREPERHLLFMRPEAVEAYLTCLDEAEQASDIYGHRAVRDRILGYLLVGESSTGRETSRVLIVAEVCLPLPLPVDEEDLLAPLPR